MRALQALVVALLALGWIPAAPPPALTKVTMTMGWDAPAPIAWITDRDFEVELDKGELVTSLVELVPCEPPKKSALRTILPSGEAHAGHLSSPELEVNRFRHLYLADLLATAPVELGSFNPPAGGYCAVFTLTSRWAGGILPSVDGFATEVTTRRLTLGLRGRYRVPGGEWQPFVAETTSADGRSWTPAGRAASLPTASTVELPAGRPTLLVITRSRAHLFDGIDFVHASSEQIARAVVANLDARVSVEAAP